MWLFMFISKPHEAQLFLKSDAVLFLNSLMLMKGDLVIIEIVGIYFNTLGRLGSRSINFTLPLLLRGHRDLRNLSF